MTALTKEMITPGLHIWVRRCKYNEPEPMEFIVVTGEVGDLNALLVNALELGKDHDNHLAGGRQGIYLGDLGVPGYAYDNRTPQVFTTRESLEEAIKMWAGRNPNFVDTNGNNTSTLSDITYREYE